MQTGADRRAQSHPGPERQSHYGNHLQESLQCSGKRDAKESILDIKAETEQGEVLDLEIHLLYDADFIHRNVYYHGGMITQALESGEEYVKIKKTISIFIVDFCLFPQTDQYASKFLFKEERENFVLTELVELHYLELPKVNPGREKTAGELTKLERYLEYLRCAGDASCREYLEDLRSQGGKEIAMTEKLLRKATADEIVREQAIARDKFRLQQHCREVQFKKGLAQAFEDGQEGKERKKDRKSWYGIWLPAAWKDSKSPG